MHQLMAGGRLRRGPSNSSGSRCARTRARPLTYIESDPCPSPAPPSESTEWSSRSAKLLLPVSRRCAQAHRLHAIVDDVEADVVRTAHLLRRDGRDAGIAPQLSSRLRASFAARSCRRSRLNCFVKRRCWVAVHYWDWFAVSNGRSGDRGRRQGLPSTFLTQVARSPRSSRCGRARGSTSTPFG